jgi:CO/xanthine dehydrogenase Mo-binding subunit
MATGCYDIPALDYQVIGVYTNTAPNGAYRGAGRPEAAYYIERVADLVADATGLDPVDVRRVNFIRPEQFPFNTLAGPQYDTGEYDKSLDKAIEVAGYAELRKEQAEQTGEIHRYRACDLRRDLRFRSVGKLDGSGRTEWRRHDFHRNFSAWPRSGDDLRPARFRLHRGEFR